MTVRGNHLQCDGREFCLACRFYTWPPNPTIPKKYYRCKHCHLDFLCEGGLWITFHYSPDGQLSKEIQCNRCYEPIEELIWPQDSSLVFEKLD